MESENMIVIESLSDLGKDLAEVKDALNHYKEEHSILYIDGTEVQPIFLLLFLEHVLSLQREKIKKSQREGIELALRRKHEGNGRYGRPRMILPEDFHERVSECFKNNYPLSDYYDEIKMKRSTFYKYANRIKKEMLSEK